MNEEQLRTTIEQVKAQVKAKPEYKEKSEDEIDELILDGFFKSYTEGKLSKEDLGGIANVMGYEFTDEFEAEEAEPKEDLDGLSKEELEETRTIKPGETKEDFEEKIEEAKDGEEEEERKKASKLWKIDL